MLFQGLHILGPYRPPQFMRPGRDSRTTVWELKIIWDVWFAVPIT